MPLECLNPDDLATPETYSHVVTTSPGRMVFVAGQVAEDADGNLVGPGDLGAQAHKAFENVGRALAAAGARPDHVARITIYVRGYRPEHVPVVEAGRQALFGDHKPADALVGVETLADPERLIEVDAIAVVDGHSAFGDLRVAGEVLAGPPLDRPSSCVSVLDVPAPSSRPSISSCSPAEARRS